MKTLTARETAEILGVSLQRVYKLLGQGRIGTRKTGIQLEKVFEYKITRKNGRPQGSYKKEV